MEGGGGGGGGAGEAAVDPESTTPLLFFPPASLAAMTPLPREGVDAPDAGLPGRAGKTLRVGGAEPSVALPFEFLVGGRMSRTTHARCFFSSLFPEGLS